MDACGLRLAEVVAVLTPRDLARAARYVEHCVEPEGHPGAHRWTARVGDRSIVADAGGPVSPAEPSSADPPESSTAGS